MENDFIPELINDSKQSQKHAKILETPPPIISKNVSTNVHPTPSQSNPKFTTDFSNNSYTEYEKRNNGSIFEKSQEKRDEEEDSEKNTERARQIAQAKGQYYTEDSEKKKLFTHGATSSRKYVKLLTSNNRNHYSDTNEFSISSRRKRSIKGKKVIQKNELRKVNLRRNISSIAQSRAMREKEKLDKKKRIESERRRKIMEKQKEQDIMNLQKHLKESPMRSDGTSPGKSNTNYKPNPNYLISGTPQPSIALMNQNEIPSPFKKAESEKSLPVSKAEMHEKYLVREEPANIKKYQEEKQDRVSNGRNTLDVLDDSVNVKNFDSMEINRVTNIDYKNDPPSQHLSKKKPIQKKEINSPNHESPTNKKPFNVRTPLHRKKTLEIKKSKKMPQMKKKETMEDYTMDEIELRGMETNELLKYYDRQYKVNVNDVTNDQGDDNTETHNQTMNTNDMLKSGQNQQSSITEISEDSLERDKNEEDSLSIVNTTKVIHREVHDPEMKKTLRDKQQMPDQEPLKDSLKNDLLTKTQTQIQKDLSADNGKPAKSNPNLISRKKNTIPRSPNKTIKNNQIPATRKVTPNSGQNIQIEETKTENIPQALGKVPSKSTSESQKPKSPGKRYEIPTPSLQSTISKSNAEGTVSDIQVDESEPPEISYSGSPDIPMTSKVHSESPSDVPVKDYNILKYPNSSNLQDESREPEKRDEEFSESQRNTFPVSLESGAKERIFDVESPEGDIMVETNRSSGIKESPIKTMSDFDNRISENKNRILLSDMGDASKGDGRSQNSVPNEKEVRDDEPGEVPEEGQLNEDSFMLHPTKSPNMKKLVKNQKRKKPKKKKQKNPFHDSDEEEEQVFAKTENATDTISREKSPGSPDVDASTAFLMTAMTTPNIKKKKKSKSRRRKKKTPNRNEHPQPKKAYNLIENHVVPKFNTLGDKRGMKEQPVQSGRPGPRTNVQPTYDTIKKHNREMYKQKPQKKPYKNKDLQNNFEMPKTKGEHIQSKTKPMQHQSKQNMFGVGNRFTLGKQAQRMNFQKESQKEEVPRRGERGKTRSKERVGRVKTETRNMKVIMNTKSTSEKRVHIKKLLRKSNKRLRQEVEENNIRRSKRSKSRSKDGVKEYTLDHENEMNKYALKGIDRQKIKKEVYLKNSLLKYDVPEINPQLQRDLDNYKASEIKKKMDLKNSSKGRNRSVKRKNKKDRLKQLEREIAELTHNVERQVEDNEVFKSKVKRKYEDDI